MSKWDERFLEMAALVASWSKDPSTRVGAVIARPDNTVVATGYNGFPRGCCDDDSILSDRNKKLARTVHAELNALLHAKEPLDDCTIYVTHPPCSQCAAAIIQSRVAEVVYKKPTAELIERWGDSLNEGISLLTEGGVYFVEVS